MFFSVIIPVFNRPSEAFELLASLSHQSFKDFEVILVEDGSVNKADQIASSFQSTLSVRYFFQENQGQGFARNFGMDQAKGDFFVILDSDVILPESYLSVLKSAILSRKLDAFGGPDAAASDFSDLQKAMDFAMTSFWTTGGIRGKLKDPSKYQARGFNMGVSRAVFESIGGFVDPNQGEDIEWSIRIKKAGFTLELVEDAFVYHKRKNTLLSFAKQAFSFGRNRVNVSRFHPEAIKLVHWLPTFFLFFLFSIVLNILVVNYFPIFHLGILGTWGGLVMVSATQKYKSIWVGVLSLLTSLVQLCGYGAGLVFERFKKALKG
ncbi:glycosyltransferase [Algoriphagus litoralis]|uniref:glycosyltransferase n=1 Tax=Algoriphagus litoralis TaxID=2202829 RepID=UPI000DBAA4B2|nr:glycosyltransferase [Algoriphagus litoralis]